MAMLRFSGGNASPMRGFRFVWMLILSVSCLRLQAQESAPAANPATTQSQTPDGKAADHGAAQAAAKGTRSAAAPKRAASQAKGKSTDEVPAVDAAKVTGTTFESDYFKFTYELPKDWKALNDAARIASNQALTAEDRDRAAQMMTSLPKKASSKPPTAKKGPGPGNSLNPLPATYNLMAASSYPINSLDSPVLPRINIWAHERVGALDTPKDHAQFLASNQRGKVLFPPQEISLDGHDFVRVDVITPTGEYVSEYVSILKDYLVGFDFRAQSEKEMAEMSETMKTLKFR